MPETAVSNRLKLMEIYMANFKRLSIWAITTIFFIGLLTGCGLFGVGPKDGNGPRQESSGTGPFSGGIYHVESGTSIPEAAV